MGYDYSPNEEAGNTAWDVWGGVGALTATSVAALPASSEAADAPRRLAAPLWVGALLLIPPTRRLGRALVVRLFGDRISAAAATSLFGPRRVRVKYGAPQHREPDPAAPAPSVTSRVRDTEPIEGEIIDPR